MARRWRLHGFGAVSWVLPSGIAVLAFVGDSPGDAASFVPQSGGIFGYSGNPAHNKGQICSSCHNGGQPPLVTLSGPLLVQAGKTYSYELTIAGGQKNEGGLCVSTTDGTLADTTGETRIDGTGTQLTHRQPKSVNLAGEVHFVFDWTPVTPGSATMYGAGNSTDNSGNTIGDFPAKDKLAITVESCVVDFTEYGSGTAGSGGFVPALTGIDGSCAGGSSLEILDGVGGAGGFLWLSDQEAALPFLNGHLWIDITSLWIKIPIHLNGPAGVPGAGTLSLPAGDLGFAQGSTFYLQALLLDPAAFGKLALSNGVRIDIGV